MRRVQCTAVAVAALCGAAVACSNPAVPTDNAAVSSEPAPPAASGPCLDLAAALSDAARIDHEAIRLEFVAIGVSDGACSVALRQATILETVTTDQTGLAAQRLLELTTAKHRDVTSAQRDALAQLGAKLVRQYLEIAADGSEDLLPRGKGTSQYLGFRIRVRLTSDALHVDHRQTTQRFEPDYASTHPAQFAEVLRDLIRAETRGPLKPPEALMLHATRDATWSAVVPTLKAAKAAGLNSVGVAVRRDKLLRQTTFELSTAHAVEAPIMRRTASTTELEGRVMPDNAALQSVAGKWKRLYPSNALVRVSASPDAPLQEVIAATEAIANCELDDAMKGDEVPEQCLLWRALLEL